MALISVPDLLCGGDAIIEKSKSQQRSHRLMVISAFTGLLYHNIFAALERLAELSFNELSWELALEHFALVATHVFI